MSEEIKNEKQTPIVPKSGDLSNLTGKNSDYIHSVTKQLGLAGKSDSEVREILSQIIPQILEAQKNGKTARSLFGAPTKFVADQSDVSKKPSTKEKGEYNKNPWLMWLDNFLLIFALLLFVNGLMTYFQKNVISYGLTTLLLSSIVGGGAMFLVYRAQVAAADPDKRTGRFRPTLLTALALILWMLVTMGTAFITGPLNPTFPNVAMMLAAVVVYGSRFFLRRQLHIQPSMISRTQTRK